MNFKYVCIFGNSLYALAFQKDQDRHHTRRYKMLVLQAHPVSNTYVQYRLRVSSIQAEGVQYQADGVQHRLRVRSAG